jgi:cell division protein FtsZ
LISITGGKDLTLFEVDEAATRIREEVDQDANIIVGATFDESLDGMIRVSVVATGVDQAVARAAPPARQPTTQAISSTENRLAELTARLRADNQRLAERAAAARGEASIVPDMQPAQEPVTAAKPQTERAERAALAAIAAAVAPEMQNAPSAQAVYDDVRVRTIQTRPSLFPDHDDAPREDYAEPAPAAFVPMAAERIPVRTPRMPDFDELPLPAQNEIRHARGEEIEDQPERRRKSLLQRIADGFGRREDEEQAASARPAAPRMPPLPERMAPRMPRPQSEPVSDYARRGRPQGLDQMGRPGPAPQQHPTEDHLDIPAFLRRAN